MCCHLLQTVNCDASLRCLIFLEPHFTIYSLSVNFLEINCLLSAQKEALYILPNILYILPNILYILPNILYILPNINIT
jgi:hypothetical protein